LRKIKFNNKIVLSIIPNYFNIVTTIILIIIILTSLFPIYEQPLCKPGSKSCPKNLEFVNIFINQPIHRFVIYRSPIIPLTNYNPIRMQPAFSFILLELLIAYILASILNLFFQLKRK